MLSARAETVLRSIVTQYIEDAVPVSSTGVIDDCGLDVCSATVRNEMVRLEHDGYIIRTHHSAGSIPSDKGYRYFVESLKDVELPEGERFLIDHLFHQVEKELEQWLNLTVALIARQVHNVAVITELKPGACKYHHLELASLEGARALAVLILRGAIVKQQLITFNRSISQVELTTISNKLNDMYSGLTRLEIKAKEMALPLPEQQVADSVVRIMKAEDEEAYEDSHLDGLHFMMEQPEFRSGRRVQSLLELIEQGRLGSAIIPEEPVREEVKVVIGNENRDEVIHDYSVVLGRYGLPDEALGTIGVIGPTRMHYGRAISTVRYLSSVMTSLVAELYGRQNPSE